MRKFARGLGIPEAAAAGHLFALWGWAMTYAADGNLSGMGADDIAWAAGWTGDAQEFLTAAMQCGIRGTGFLEENERGEIVLHRWDEHMGDRFERREKEATRLREYRKKQSDPKAGDKPGDSVPSTYDVRTPYVHSTDDVRTAYVRGTYDVRGEEMKREENISPPISPPAGGGGREGEPTPAEPNEQKTAEPETAKYTGESLPAERPHDSGGARPTDGNEAEYPEAFAAFWAAYPRRVQKQVAAKAWRTLTKQGVGDADILSAAAAYGAATARKGTPPDRILHPSTFLHEGRWRDWLPPHGASYREALGHTTRGEARRDEPGSVSYADAVAKYGGAPTVDIAPGDWHEVQEQKEAAK